MLTIEQTDFYKENGYLTVEEVITKGQLNKLQEITYEFIERSRQVTENDDIFDLDEGHSAESPRLTRIKLPHKNNKYFDEILKRSGVTEVLRDLLGDNATLLTSKLNTKAPGGGMAVEWHQDWAFYPHTNDDLITVGIYLDDCFEKNGPLKIIKSSHKKKLYNHQNKENFFIGKIDLKKNKIGINKSVSITGTAGTVVFFHCRSVHGSGHNHMDSSRPLILFGYRACDAWPLINDGNPHPEVDLENYDKNIIVGKKSIKPRLTKVPTIIPLPKKKHYVSIYELQKNKY